MAELLNAHQITREALQQQWKTCVVERGVNCHHDCGTVSAKLHHFYVSADWQRLGFRSFDLQHICTAVLVNPDDIEEFMTKKVTEFTRKQIELVIAGMKGMPLSAPERSAIIPVILKYGIITYFQRGNASLYMHRGNGQDIQSIDASMIVGVQQLVPTAFDRSADNQ